MRPRMKSRRVPVLGLILALSGLLTGQETGPRTRLALGDPRFRSETVDVAPGQVVSRETGKPVSFEQMILDLEPVPFVLVGESHDSLATHELQARVIRALHDRDPLLAVGLESVPAARQEILSRWSRGLLSEEEFLRQSGWYSGWGFAFAYYRPIFALARDRRIPLWALDSPREVVGRFQVRDGEVLPEEERTAPAPPGPADEDGLRFLRASLESSDLPAEVKGAVLERMLEDLYRAQADRDADMAARAVEARKREGRKIVVLIGSGHLLYGLGLERPLRALGGLPSRSVVAVGIPEGHPSVTVSRAMADYIVGLPEEERPAYPEIGLAFKNVPESPKLVIAGRPGRGVARGLDFEENDLVLSVDGRTFPGVEDLLIYLHGLAWGDEARFRILRRGVERTVVLKIGDPRP